MVRRGTTRSSLTRSVDPIELVVFLPALCRKMGVPYVVVSNKARLGAVVGRKTAAVIVRRSSSCAFLTRQAFETVRSEDQAELAKLVSAAKANYVRRRASLPC